jgi:DNA-binding FadR family transcriptional regulator
MTSPPTAKSPASALLSGTATADWRGPIVPRYVADDVQDRLVTAIALGVYVPGQRLPTERELAALLEVSRTSVRAALQQMTDAGYLEVRRGRMGGYFVLADWGPTSAERVNRHLVPKWAAFESLFDARNLIEPLIAATAAQRCTLEDMTIIIEALDAYCAAPDRETSMLADYALHHAIASATHNPILVELSVEMRARVSLNLGAEPYTAQVRRTAIAQHKELVAAVTDNHPEEAARLAAIHFALTEDLIRSLVSRAQAPDEAQSIGEAQAPAEAQP